MGHCSQLCSVGDFRIQPVPQAGRIKHHGLTFMDMLQVFAGRFGDDGAGGGLVAFSRGPEAGEENRRILPGIRWRYVVRFFPMFRLLPFVPAIGRYQATVMGKGVPEVF